MTPVCTIADAVPGGRGRWISTRAQIALTCCAGTGATAFLFAVDPNHHAVYPQCILYNTTGIYCAGCGATRALYALLHGRPLEALHDNALLILVLPIVLYMTIPYVLTSWKLRAWKAVAVAPDTVLRIGIVFFFVMIVFMFLRNLPGVPFDWLKPLTACG